MPTIDFLPYLLFTSNFDFGTKQKLDQKKFMPHFCWSYKSHLLICFVQIVNITSFWHHLGLRGFVELTFFLIFSLDVMFIFFKEFYNIISIFWHHKYFQIPAQSCNVMVVKLKERFYLYQKWYQRYDMRTCCSCIDFL